MKHRLKMLVALYGVLLAIGIALALLERLGLLPAILIIAASVGLLHLAYTHFFSNLPNYLDELQGGRRRNRGDS
jgi:fatty acid desaturase